MCPDEIDDGDSKRKKYLFFPESLNFFPPNHLIKIAGASEGRNIEEEIDRELADKNAKNVIYARSPVQKRAACYSEATHNERLPCEIGIRVRLGDRFDNQDGPTAPTPAQHGSETESESKNTGRKPKRKRSKEGLDEPKRKEKYNEDGSEDDENNDENGFDDVPKYAV